MILSESARNYMDSISRLRTKPLSTKDFIDADLVVQDKHGVYVPYWAAEKDPE